jgi:hypothetical protein
MRKGRKANRRLRRAVALGNHNYNLHNDPEYQKIMEEVRDHIEQYRKTVAAD